MSGGKTSHSWVRRNCLRELRRTMCQVEKRHTALSGGTVLGRSGEPCVRWKNVTQLCQVEKRHTAVSGGTVSGRSGEPCVTKKNVTQLGQEKRYTHKTSGFKTSGFKTSGFKTSETSGLQNVRFTKCEVYKTSGLQNVWLKKKTSLYILYLW